MSVSQKLARYALDLTFNVLPPEVVHQSKRLILDTLGCALGGYSSDASRIARKVIGDDLAGRAEATIIGSVTKTSSMNATIANGAMVRFLDYNDVGYSDLAPPVKLLGHNSEVIPAALAVGEGQHRSGKELIAAIVAGYELSARFMRAVIGPDMERRGWNMDTRAAYVMPLVVGKLMGLTEEQMVNAVGICGSHSLTLGILDATGEEYTMAKNIRFPLASHGAILAALLARQGFTGPPRVIEGHGGFIEAVLRGDFNVDELTTHDGKFYILNAAIKSIIADYSTHGHLTATLTLVREHDIRPEDVVSVKVTASSRSAWHTGDPVKKYPVNKETADHSSYYLTAIAITERALGPDQFSPEKYNDPRVRSLIDKVTIEADPELDKMTPAGASEIVTGQGKTYSLKVEYPRGHPLNPMTDREVEQKFRSMAVKLMAEQQIEGVLSAVWDLDRMQDVGSLMNKLAFHK